MEQYQFWLLLGTVAATILLTGLLNIFTTLTSKGQILMAISASEQALLDAFNTETTRLADLISGLDQDDPEFNTQLQSIVDRLRAIGANPNQPVPPVPQVE